MASRSRSRSPLNHDDGPLESGKSSPTPSQISLTSNNSGNNQPVKQAKSTTGKHILRLFGVPFTWKWQNVASYIKKHTNCVDMAIGAEMFITMKKNGYKQTQHCVIEFQTEQRKHQAFELLRKTVEKINGKKLFVADIKEAASNQPFLPKAGLLQKFKRNITQKPGEINDINETYGLSVDYLRELEISLPLTRKVFVKYLPLLFSDETKIRSVFGKAGTITMLEIVPKENYINARILYDHPVEAVQAISMFNNRDFYGKSVNCTMDTKLWVNTDVMQGPGLGPNGTPIRGVRVNAEVEKVRDEIMKECQSLNDTIDEMKSQISTLLVATNRSRLDMATLTQPVGNLKANSMPNVTNPLAALDTLLTSQIQPMQLLQSLVQQNSIGNALQNWTGSNLGNIWQQGQSNNQVQAGGNMQGGVNMQGGHNIQGDVNMQGGPIMQALSNMQGGANMQSGPNDILRGPPNNMAPMPFNMQSVPASNMQSSNAPMNIHTLPANMQVGNFNLQMGPTNMHSGPPNIQPGHLGIQGQINNNIQSENFNIQMGPTNMHGGPLNIQPGHLGIQGQINNPGFFVPSNQQ